MTVWPNVHSDERQKTGVSDVRPEGELIASGLGKLQPAPAGTIKDGLYDVRPVGQNQRFARLEVAAVEHDQGAAVCRPARHVGAIDATLQPSAVKGDIVGTEPVKTLAKRSLKKTHMACGSAEANSTWSII